MRHDANHDVRLCLSPRSVVAAAVDRPRRRIQMSLGAGAGAPEPGPGECLTGTCELNAHQHLWRHSAAPNHQSAAVQLRGRGGKARGGAEEADGSAAQGNQCAAPEGARAGINARALGGVSQRKRRADARTMAFPAVVVSLAHRSRGDMGL